MSYFWAVPVAKPIDIRILSLTGNATHRGDDHPHTKGHDFIAAGEAALGALSYSLLRAEAMTLYWHRASGSRGARAVRDRLIEDRKIIERMASVDVKEAQERARQLPRLTMWDLIACVGEACEQLAAVHGAVRAWRRTGADIGKTLISWTRPSYLVFPTVDFQSVAWWRSELGLDPDPTLMRQLTAGQRHLIKEIFEQVDARLPDALDALATQYTPELHRVAVRRRHLIPLLDATIGLVFATTDPASETWLATQVDRGALILADDKVVPGQMSQIIVPVDRETEIALLWLWSHANWLSRSLAGAVISRAESPNHVAWSTDNDATLPGSDVTRGAAMAAYTGMPADQTVAELAMQQRGAAAMRLARETVAERLGRDAPPSSNRQDRRRAGRSRGRPTR